MDAALFEKRALDLIETVKGMMGDLGPDLSFLIASTYRGEDGPVKVTVGFEFVDEDEEAYHEDDEELPE